MLCISNVLSSYQYPMLNFDLKGLNFFIFSFLLPYSFIQIFGASYVDRIFSSPAILISVCLSITSISMCLSGFAGTIYSYCIWVAVSGIAQGPIWPACAKLMAKACQPTKKASVLGNLKFCIISSLKNIFNPELH